MFIITILSISLIFFFYLYLYIGLIVINLVNPNKISVETEGEDENYFPNDSPVVANVPYTLRVVSLIYFLFGLIGSICIQDPPHELILYNEKTNTNNFTKIIDQDDEENNTNNKKNNLFTINTYDSDEDNHHKLDNNEEDDEEIIFHKSSTISFGIELKQKKYNTINNNDNHHEDNEEEEEVHNFNTTYNPFHDTSLDSSPTSSSNSPSTSSPTSLRTTSNYSPMEIIFFPLTYQISLCLILTTVGGMYLAATYKVFGQQVFDNKEKYLSLISSFSSIFNSIGRIFWGNLSDKYEPINVLLIMSSLFSLLIFLFPYTISNLSTFTLFIFLMFFFEGGNFVLYIPIVINLYGDKYSGSNYGLIFTSYSFAVVIMMMTLSFFTFTFSTVCIFISTMLFIGFLFLLLLKKNMKFFNK